MMRPYAESEERAGMMMHDEHADRKGEASGIPTVAGEAAQIESDESRAEFAARPLHMAVVSVQQMFYGFRIDTVREILRVPKITWVPWTPEYVAGILNVRGDMLMIVDVGLFLRRGVSRVSPDSRIVVVESRGLAAGLLVDALVDIPNVPMATFQALAEDAEHGGEDDPEARRYGVGHGQWQNRAVTLLDSDRMLQGLVVNQG